MKRDGYHTHTCSNKGAGCKGTYRCSDDYLEQNHDPDGVYCSVDPFSEGECLDCQTSQCSECGAVLHISKHEEDCAKATAV